MILIILVNLLSISGLCSVYDIDVTPEKVAVIFEVKIYLMLFRHCRDWI